MNLTDLLADAVIARQVGIFRFDAHLRRRIASMLEATAMEVIARLSDAENLTTFSKTRLEALLREIGSLIATDYKSASEYMAKQLGDLAADEARWLASTIESMADVPLKVPPRSVLAALATETMIQGAPSAAWWARQSGDAVFRFKAAIRQGMVQGEGIAAIVARIRRDRGALGEIAVVRRNAEALVRTSVMTVSAAARTAMLKDNADIIKGQQQLSTLDNRTTDICIAYDGASWDLEGKPINGTKLPFNGGPPRHWNCRSTLVPITKSYKELGLDVPERSESNRASMDGQVARNLSFADWLKAKPAEFQDDLLGRGRAELWRSGRITLQQLLDFRGNSLTLAQLRKRYAS
jgi:SPP1 gp7 family putative phage head morphogenesis protein